MSLKNLIRFIISSYLFKVVVLMTVVFIAVIWAANKMFDTFWGTESFQPLTNLYDVYEPPPAYDNTTRIRIKLTGAEKLAVECNKKFRFISGTEDYTNKNYDHYDTIAIRRPMSEPDYTNKIYLQVEKSSGIDSIFLVVTGAVNRNLYWNQIFYSSIPVSEINKFSSKEGAFRVSEKILVETGVLNDNDTLIDEAFNSLNKAKDTMKTYECGTNCAIFRSICDMHNLPCRIVGLQGGDANATGFDDKLGYPLHAICEVYSSRLMKWYVIDPTYGFRFKDPSRNDYYNAVEISNKYFFASEKEIIQDSVLFTKRSLVGRDYFKYYENIFYNVTYKESKWTNRFVKLFFKKSDFYVYQYSNNLLLLKNGYYYMTIKSLMYLLIIVLYLNTVFVLVVTRLYKVKKPLIKKS